jgi:hypothetical protein
MERDFKGVWIDKEIWLNKELSWMEKLFITEINSLDNKNGCYASNDYFSEFFQLSKSRCSQIINSLIKKKYISAKYEYNGKEIKKRVLRILNWGIKNTKEGIEKMRSGYLENAKDINTINNTINNNIRPPKKSKFIPPKDYHEIEEICKKNNYNVDAEYFFNYYNTNNWKKSNGKPIKNLKLTLLTWHRNNQNWNPTLSTITNNTNLEIVNKDRSKNFIEQKRKNE